MIGQTALAVTDTATEKKIDSRHLLLVNDGSKTVYVQAEQGTDFPGQVTATATSFFSIAAGEHLLMDAELPFKAFSVICAVGEISTIRWAAW